MDSNNKTGLKNKKTILFDDNNANDEEEDKLIFEKALKKKQFQGKQGHMLMELQNSYKNDKRFLLDNKFKGDIDTRKVSRNVKNMTHIFDKEKNTFSTSSKTTNRNDPKAEDLIEEKNKNLNILSQVVSNTEFLTHNKKFRNPKNLIIKRFDPKFNIGKELVIKNEIKPKEEEKKNTIKLEKGIDKNDYDQNLLPADKNKKNKEKSISKIMNQLNDNLESKVEINYKSWKDIINSNKSSDVKSKPPEFSLFNDGTTDNIEKVDIPSAKPLVLKVINNNLKNDENDKILDKQDKKEFLLFENDNSVDVGTANKKSQFLKKKRQKKNEQKKLKEKKLKEEIKLQEKIKDEKIEKTMKKNLLKTFDEEKVENYMRYVNLVRQTKIKQNRK